jgi:hypothetical protein
MGLLSRRKNKRFEYEPRYHKMEEGERPFEIKHKFDEYRTTVGKPNLRSNFDNAMNDYKQGSDAATKKRLYIIIGILILAFLWLIEFDLSIFKFKI